MPYISDAINETGTDRGPACWRCSGTVWLYYQVADGCPPETRRWHARCCGCDVAEGPIDSPGEPDGERLRKAHAAFLDNWDADRDGPVWGFARRQPTVM